jgi:hypothetical protein
MAPDKICGEIYEHHSGFVEVCTMPIHNVHTLNHNDWRPATKKENDAWKKSSLQRATIYDLE